MAQARVIILHEVKKAIGSDGWELCFQWVRYVYDDGNLETGYRFIWRRPDGSLQGARGQARIPSIDIAQELIQRAIDEGWGNKIGSSH